MTTEANQSASCPLVSRNRPAEPALRLPYYTTSCNSVVMAMPSRKRRAESKVTGVCEAAGAVTASAGKPPLRERPLITVEQADEVIGLFQVLANATRLRLLHALERDRELSVNDLADAIGMRPQGVSNQLQRLRDRGILASRREGNRIFYRVADPCVTSLLALGLCLSEETR